MAFAYIIGAAVQGPNTVVTTGVNTSGADLIVLTVSAFDGNAGTLAISDSKSNTWTAKTIRNSTSDGTWCRQFYCVSPTVGSGHTFTCASSSAFPAFFMESFSGVDTASAFDQESGNNNGGSTVILVGSITPGGANYLFVTGMMTPATGTHTIDSGFTVSHSLPFVGGTAEGGAMAYKISTGSSAENPIWTKGAAATAAASMLTFKVASGGGPTFNTGRNFGVVMG